MMAKASNDQTEFLACLLHAVTVVHMHHLMVTGQGSYAKHTALGSLYEDLRDEVDSLTEAYVGLIGQVPKFVSGQFEIGTDPVADVQMIYDEVQAKRQLLGNESFIQNELDEICKTLSSALYKLRNLA